MLKRLGKIALIIVVILAAVAVIFIGPINRRPLDKRDFYIKMENKLDTFSAIRKPATAELGIGWDRENLMPDWITPMAGYAPRNQYETVHDSLFVHAMVLDNGAARVALVSFDLLITPPLLYDRIQKIRNEVLPDIDFIYFSAGHTHNGIGGWEDSPGGQLMSGNFNEEILGRLVESTVACIKKAAKTMVTGKLSYFESDGSRYVRNRLDREAAEDGKIRGVGVETTDGRKALLTVFSAHATNIPSGSLAVSADYPGRLVQELEKEAYDFAMFMSGAVGSHRLDSIEETAFERVEKAGVSLAEMIMERAEWRPLESWDMAYETIPVEFGPSQMRLGKHFRLRDWAFRLFFSPLQGGISYLKIGDLQFLGMPCDFSGELAVEERLYELAARNGNRLIITSFNGNYVGYITADHHYDHSSRHEVREMNWVGPYYGEYFAGMIEQILNKTGQMSDANPLNSE